MPDHLEIERKFLVISDAWKAEALPPSAFRQGYLRADERATVRVRLAGEEAWLTIKGMRTGISRAEFEYPIPTDEALLMLEGCCGECIEKDRYRVPHAGHVWEVDVFHGANAGLVVAEVELEAADEKVVVPEWVGEEVSEDVRYTNSYLSLNPVAGWG